MTVPRSEPTIRYILEILGAFWERVIRREAPPPDWADPATPDLIKALYPPTAPGITLTGEQADEAAALIRVRELQGEREARAKSERKIATAKLREMLGNAQAARLPDGTLITRKMVERSGYTVGATTYEDLRVSKAKVKARV